MEKLEILIQEAKELGIPNPTMYRLLPKEKQIESLQKDIRKAKESAPAE